MKFTLIEPPASNSLEELEDLSRVIEQYSNRVVPESLQQRCDDDADGMMAEYLANRAAYVDLKNLSKVRMLCIPIISELKNHFMRARPVELAAAIGVKFEGDFLESAQTPSYPSGHTIQAYVLATFCSKLYPEHSEGLFMIAEMVSQSRIDRGVHFPSDVDYGRLIAKEITDQAFGQ